MVYRYIIASLLLVFFLPTDLAFGQPKSMLSLQNSFSPVVKKVGPAVVNISTQKVVRRQVSPFAKDPFFQMFFGSMLPGVTQDRVERSLGSGVIVQPDGLFVTNYHVIKGADKVNVLLSDNREFEAKLIDADPQFDLAIMQINAQGEALPFAKFGDSNTLDVGDIVLAIGNPFGVGQSVSMGIVSALGRSNVAHSPMGDFIQTDAAINPGNSGGALVSAAGEVVGINTAIFTRSGGSDGIGFAIPAHAVRAVVESVINTGRVQRGWLGAGGQDVNQVLADNLGLKRPKGVLVNEVAPKSPADKAGLQVGDIILRLAGHEVPNAHGLKARVATTPIHEKTALQIWRSGRLKTLTIVLTPPPEPKKGGQITLEGPHPLKGYGIENLTPFIAQQLGLNMQTKGVVIVQAPRGGLGLQVGDLVEALNGQKIKNIQELQNALKNNKRQGWDIVYRRGQRVFRLRLR